MARTGYYKIWKSDADSYWYWRYIASNGEQISRSTDGYYNKSDCRRSIEIMKDSKYDPVID